MTRHRDERAASQTNRDLKIAEAAFRSMLHDHALGLLRAHLEGGGALPSSEERAGAARNLVQAALHVYVAADTADLSLIPAFAPKSEGSGIVLP